MIIPALNPATIGGAPPLRAYVALAERDGFGGVEFNVDEVITLAGESSWGAVRAIFEQYEVAPASFGLPVQWRGNDESFRNDLATLPEKAKAAREIGCSRTCTWLPPAIHEQPEEFKSVIARRFHAVAAVLAEQEIYLGLEFVGPETLRVGPAAMGPHPFIYTMQQTLELIEIIDAPGRNIGLLIDSFHWFTTKGTAENLIALSPSQIVHVHINDAPDKPISEQIDKERLLPGDGVIDLRAFLGTLAEMGYNGFAAVETFNAALAALGPDAAAERAGAAVEKVFASLRG